MTRKLKVLLVDDHPMVREWLTSLIEQQPDMSVCGEADNITDAVKVFKTASPDIAVVDLSLKEASGLELVKTIKARWPNVGIVVLSMHEEEIYAERSIRAGARGYVTKTISGEELTSAVHRVADGDAVFSPRLAGFVLDAFRSGDAVADPELDQLTAREREVLQLIARGYRYKEIAARLHLSPRTVESHVSAVLRKLQLSSRHELTRWAAERRLI